MPTLMKCLTKIFPDCPEIEEGKNWIRDLDKWLGERGLCMMEIHHTRGLPVGVKVLFSGLSFDGKVCFCLGEVVKGGVIEEFYCDPELAPEYIHRKRIFILKGVLTTINT